ncbi:hydroxymethylglutaryl-CoA lyase [Sporobolomyces salmoneus]|uniref:hydroxymethylglutaryl-CoA lyase n=1 Tax=Sporobolomyces salmoneus TaxID=183962 RepID=UPI00316DE0AE
MLHTIRTASSRRVRTPKSILPLTQRNSSSLSLKPVKIVEVGPRDGLQNEKRHLKTELKVELIEKLVGAGCRDVESGSFVSPKWMASTPEVLTSLALSQLRETYSSLSLPVLVPNDRGLDSLFSLLDANPSAAPPLTNEIAVFVAASNGFSKANLNCTVSESLARLPSIIERARGRGLRVRGYVSTVLGCPFDGKVDPKSPANVAKELLDMGVYEVSLGDTIGVGVPQGWEALVNECERLGVGADKLAAHCHDTYGTALANVLHYVKTLGITTVDSSISALGGCPYSPNSTGNVSTEDVLYLLSCSNVPTTLIPNPMPSEQLIEENETFAKLCETGEWISRELGRENGSRVGKAWRQRRERAEKMKS